MRLPLLPLIVLIGPGCSFYEKNYISETELQGTNYRGRIFDEGVFYINAEPAIEIRMGCYARTELGETMFVLIPIPILREISSGSHNVHFVRTQTPGYGSSIRYEYAAGISCGEVDQGVLTIELDSGETRRFDVHFKEGVKRHFAWHPGFVT